jgi:hypothetical protein
MTTEEQLAALSDAYQRLRIAAQAVVDAASYDPGGEGRVYEVQLADLQRELMGEPQPNGMAWMSIS